MAQPKTILVTGATSGIGRATALRLSQRGHRVFATGRRPDSLEELAREAGTDRLHTLPLEVCDEASIRSAVATVDAATEGRGLDVLVNNAGYAQGGAVLDVPLDAIRAQYETNVFGLLAVTRAFSDAMFRRGAGRIINVSSVAGRLTLPTTGIYNSSKYAVESLSDAMRIECGAFGVQVVLIEPGAIRTNFNATLKAKKDDAADPETSRWASAYAHFDDVVDKSEKMASKPEAVAKVITKAVEARRPRARYLAPPREIVTLWLVGMLPTFVFDFVRRRMAGLHRPQLPPG